MATKEATVKRNIKPVTFTLTVEASKVNENGTFSGITVKSVKGPNDSISVSVPPMSGGAMYLKMNDEKNIVYLSDGEKSAKKVVKKFF